MHLLVTQIKITIVGKIDPPQKNKTRYHAIDKFSRNSKETQGSKL